MGFRASGFAQFAQGAQGRSAARAALLLPRPCPMRPGDIAAHVLAAIKAHGPLHSRNYEGENHRLLGLRGAFGFLTIGSSPTPLGAAAFARAIPPFSSAKRRAALMRVIAHHEAALSLRLYLRDPKAGFAGWPLHRALAAVADELAPMGLLWGRHGVLFEGLEARRLLAQPEPTALFVAPRLISIGPRRLPAIRFEGARALLGLGVTLHLLEMDFHAARRLGLAFIAAALSDPALPYRQSFAHDGQGARISHREGAPDIALIPLPARPPVASVA